MNSEACVLEKLDFGVYDKPANRRLLRAARIDDVVPVLLKLRRIMSSVPPHFMNLDVKWWLTAAISTCWIGMNNTYSHENCKDQTQRQFHPLIHKLFLPHRLDLWEG
jgi:hypothetical protein